MSSFNPQSDANAERRRRSGDYYATPAYITEALLSVETFQSWILEPACGEGWLSEVLKRHGYDVLSSDLIGRGYGVPRIDFLEQTVRVPNIVTNPPFQDGLNVRFVEHALKLATRKVAMLLPLTFLETRQRSVLLHASPFKCVYIFRSRVGCVNCGSPSIDKHYHRMCFAWFVWEHGHVAEPVIRWT